MARNTVDNPFSTYRDAVLVAAGELYRAEKAGVDPDVDISRISILPSPIGAVALSELREDDTFHTALTQEAELNAAARAVARLAFLDDKAEAGGPVGIVARVERGLTKIVEPRRTRNARESGIIDMLRGTL